MNEATIRTISPSAIPIPNTIWNVAREESIDAGVSGTGVGGNGMGDDGNGSGFAGLGELVAGFSGEAGSGTRLVGGGQESTFAPHRGQAADSPIRVVGA
jgi:hypothetical protein